MRYDLTTLLMGHTPTDYVTWDEQRKLGTTYWVPFFSSAFPDRIIIDSLLHKLLMDNNVNRDIYSFSIHLMRVSSILGATLPFTKALIMRLIDVEQVALNRSHKE